MNSRIRRRRFMGSALLFSLAVSVDSFSISPNKKYSRQRVQCHDQAADEDSDAATMSTALCVVPPDETWDTIQRARHLSRDRTYHKWPPAIRLFHPFCPRAELSNKALDIARIVEEYDIEPFQVSLTTWTIVPHMEAIEADWEAMTQLPTQEVIPEKKKVPTETDRLIAEEERLGRQRLLRREIRSRQKREQAGGSVSQAAAAAQEEDKEEGKCKKQSPRELLEKQKRMYEEFNGPCVLCLEPDEESRERLIQLRELLRAKLFEDYDKFSPSSSVSTTSTLPRAVLEAEETSFRPIVPVGNFPTVTSAVEMARKLKGLWEPLPFNVTDFHLISFENKDTPVENQLGEYSDNAEYNLKKTTSWRHVDIEEETLTAQGQFGCDALVMLMGEEVDTDEEGSKEIVNILMSQGSPGGYELAGQEAQSDEKVQISLENDAKEKDDDDTEGLEMWLDSDDEWDEGTVIVIGRTHFFTGDMRTYNGMPASNAMDAKDRVLGAGVHASARRKGSAKRASVWKDGHFGYRETDFVV